MKKAKGLKMFFLMISVLLISISLIIFLRKPICKGQILGFARPWVLVFWPPNDLFEPLIVKDIDLFDLEKEQQYQFNIKYVGPYSISILFDKFDNKSYYQTFKTNLKLKFDFYNKDGQHLLTKQSDSSYTPFLGKIGNGLILSKIDVPKEVPSGMDIKLKVKIVKADTELNKYGNSMISIKKCSEK